LKIILEVFWKLSESFLEVFWKVSGRFLKVGDNSDSYLKVI
jgi:hypothetical protein